MSLSRCAVGTPNKGAYSDPFACGGRRRSNDIGGGQSVAPSPYIPRISDGANIQRQTAKSCRCPRISRMGEETPIHTTPPQKGRGPKKGIEALLARTPSPVRWDRGSPYLRNWIFDRYQFSQTAGLGGFRLYRRSKATIDDRVITPICGTTPYAQHTPDSNRLSPARREQLKEGKATRRWVGVSQTGISMTIPISTTTVAGWEDRTIRDFPYADTTFLFQRNPMPRGFSHGDKTQLYQTDGSSVCTALRS